MAVVDDIAGLARILAQSRVIAVVGLSPNWYRPSYFAAKYMQEHGYRVIPVNPRYPEILGEKCYPSVREVPEKIDIVDVFRKSADVLPIAEDLGVARVDRDHAVAVLLHVLGREVARPVPLGRQADHRDRARAAQDAAEGGGVVGHRKARHGEHVNRCAVAKREAAARPTACGRYAPV